MRFVSLRFSLIYVFYMVKHLKIHYLTAKAMLKYLLIFLMFIHGLIHLVGFAKAFGLGGTNQIVSEISPANGVFWLICSLMLVTASILCLNNSVSWILLAAVASISSQVMVFTIWNDAKFGTIANLIIVTVVIVTAASKEMKYFFRD